MLQILCYQVTFFLEVWLELNFMVLNQNFEKILKKNEKIEKTKNVFSKIFSTRNEEHKSVSSHKLWKQITMFHFLGEQVTPGLKKMKLNTFPTLDLGFIHKNQIQKDLKSFVQTFFSPAVISSSQIYSRDI